MLPVKHIPQKRQSFYDKLKCELAMHSSGDVVMCLGDFNGHVGRHISGFDETHHVAGQKNLEGRMLLEFCLEKVLCVCQIHGLRERKRGR